MAVTFVTAEIHDPNSNANIPIEGIIGQSSLLNPSAGVAVRQTIALADGSTNGSPNLGFIDSDGNLHVIDGRVATAAATTVASSASAVELLVARSVRVSVSIWNQSSAALYLGFTSSVTAGASSNATWKVEPGAQWQMPASVSYTGALWGIWDEASGNANVADF